LSRLKGFLWKDVITVPWSPEPFRRRRYFKSVSRQRPVDLRPARSVGPGAMDEHNAHIIQGHRFSPETAPPLPLTSLQDDIAALDCALDRAPGPVVLAGHAYAGAVIAATRNNKARALVYIAALARMRARRSRTCSTALSPIHRRPSSRRTYEWIYLPEAI
jgi:hypothetical protein